MGSSPGVTLNFSYSTRLHNYVMLGLEFVTILFTSIALFTPDWLSKNDKYGNTKWSMGLYRYCDYIMCPLSPATDTSPCAIARCYYSIQGSSSKYNSYVTGVNAALAFMSIAFALELICITVFIALFVKKLAERKAIMVLMVLNGIIAFCILLGSSIFAGKANSGISDYKSYLAGQKVTESTLPYFDYSFALAWVAMVFALATDGTLVALWVFYRRAQNSKGTRTTHVSSNIEEVRRQQTVATVQVRNVGKVEERSEHAELAVVHQKGRRESDTVRGRRYYEADTASVEDSHQDVEIE